MRRTRARTSSPATPSASTTIGFRLDEASHRALCERAARLGVSPHEFARNQVLEALQGEEQGVGLAMELARLQKTVAQLRVDVATATEALLIAAGKTAADQASTWVRENLL